MHYGEGLLKIWDWSSLFTRPMEQIFNEDRGLFNTNSKVANLRQKLMEVMQFDICFLSGAIKRYSEVNQGNSIPTYLKQVFSKYEKQVNKSYSCENIQK